MNKIASQLFRFRHRKILIDLQTVGWIGLTTAAIVVILLIILEAILWFPTSIRLGVWGALFFLILIWVLAGGVSLLLIYREKINRYVLPTLAKEVGARSFEKEDEALNALQLESASPSKYHSSAQLANQFVHRVASKLASLNPAKVLNTHGIRRWRKTALGTAMVCALSIGIFHSAFLSAVDRWMHPGTNFPVPHPFELESLTGNLSLMGGDDTTLAFTATGKIPESIELELKEGEKKTLSRITPAENGLFAFVLNDVFQNLHYRAFVESDYFWQPWTEISSPTYNIEVIDRPIIEDFTMTLTPPEYTGLSPLWQKGNVAEIRGLKGSIIGIELRSNKMLSKAYLKYVPRKATEESSKIVMEAVRNRASGEFDLKEDAAFETYIVDEKKTGNLDPIQYHVMVVDDLPPDLQVIQPESPMELGSDFDIPVQLHLEDDFGFSNLHIVYETKHPDYVSGRPTYSTEGGGGVVNIHGIDSFSREETSQDMFYVWNVSDLELMPEDDLLFHFELYDNDFVSGPKKSISPTLVARFPSLADLFARTVEEELIVQEEAEEIHEDLQELDEVLESLELELLKSEKMTWEHEQSLKQSIEEVQSRLEQVQDLREKLQEIVEQSEKHDLFSPQLIEKFRDLQELLQNVMTPELRRSMERLQEAMERFPPDQLLQALENFRLNTKEVEEQLDRFIDIFQRIQAEQRMDELVTRMEELSRQQEALVDKLEEDGDRWDLLRLAEEERRNSQEFENIKDLMEEAAETTEPFASMPAKELRELSQSDLSNQTSRDLRMASNRLRRRNPTEGLRSAESARENLREMVSQLHDIQSDFRQQTVDEMVSEFETVLRNTLFVSKEQESLESATRDVPRNSPRLGKMAVRQQLLRDQMAQLIQGLIKLSRQTFAVSPEMGKAIGRATAGMNESLKKLEERNGRGAAESQKSTVAALNEAALAILAAINDMRETGMASGMEQFLKSLQKMASQQQGINEQTLQLAFGQMAAMAQQGMMRRLAREQAQLRKSLAQLQREMQGAGRGGENLGGIAHEMEEVLNDFREQNVTQRTVERQQRILTRMLDSQRALRRQDFSEKRKATVAQDIIREGPVGLPDDLGQRRSLAMEALNLALKAGYSRDYQDMIRRYFNTLIESPELIEYDDVEP